MIASAKSKPSIKISQDRDDLAEILNEIRFVREQVGQPPTGADVWRNALLGDVETASVVGGRRGHLAIGDLTDEFVDGVANHCANTSLTAWESDLDVSSVMFVLDTPISITAD
jgi:hypothetical protein